MSLSGTRYNLLHQTDLHIPVLRGTKNNFVYSAVFQQHSRRLKPVEKAETAETGINWFSQITVPNTAYNFDF